MQYAILCHNNEDVVWSWTKDEDEAVMGRLAVVHERLADKMGPAVRLLPTTAVTTLRKSPEPVVIDGPYAETKEGRSLWNGKLIAEGLAPMDKAVRHNRPGPYQVQAAIAAIHARVTRAEETDWAGIDALYAALERMQPSPMGTLNRAVATAKLLGPGPALEMIAPLEERLSGYFHYFGTRGTFLLRLGRVAEARVAFGRAIALANTPAEAAHIRRHLDRLMRTDEISP